MGPVWIYLCSSKYNNSMKTAELTAKMTSQVARKSICEAARKTLLFSDII